MIFSSSVNRSKAVVVVLQSNQSRSNLTTSPLNLGWSIVASTLQPASRNNATTCQLQQSLQMKCQWMPSLPLSLSLSFFLLAPLASLQLQMVLVDMFFAPILTFRGGARKYRALTHPKSASKKEPVGHPDFGFGSLVQLKLGTFCFPLFFFLFVAFVLFKYTLVSRTIDTTRACFSPGLILLVLRNTM